MKTIPFPATGRARTAYRALRDHAATGEHACRVVRDLEVGGSQHRLRNALSLVPGLPIVQHTSFLALCGYASASCCCTSCGVAVSPKKTVGWFPATGRVACQRCAVSTAVRS